MINTKKKLDIDQASPSYRRLLEQVQKDILTTRNTMSKAIEQEKHSLFFMIGRRLYEFQTSILCRHPEDIYAALAKDVKELLTWVSRFPSEDLKGMEELYKRSMGIQFQPESHLPFEYHKLMAEFVEKASTRLQGHTAD